MKPQQVHKFSLALAYRITVLSETGFRFLSFVNINHVFSFILIPLKIADKNYKINESLFPYKYLNITVTYWIPIVRVLKLHQSYLFIMAGRVILIVTTATWQLFYRMLCIVLPALE